MIHNKSSFWHDVIASFNGSVGCNRRTCAKAWQTPAFTTRPRRTTGSPAQRHHADAGFDWHLDDTTPEACRCPALSAASAPGPDDADNRYAILKTTNVAIALRQRRFAGDLAGQSSAGSLGATYLS